MTDAFKPFPIPVRMVGPGSHVEEDTLDYMEMPRGMDTYHAPALPEPEEVAGLDAAHAALRATRVALAGLRADIAAGAPATSTRSIDLTGLDDANRALINQVLGEGEVSARREPAGDRPGLRVQESVFAGIWRVLGDDGSDAIEIGAIPAGLHAAAPLDRAALGRLTAEAAPIYAGQLMNAPHILAEVSDQLMLHRAGRAAHVINMTLLPLNPADRAFVDERTGAGPVTLLSRGYGNCRIGSTDWPNLWRVTYYNSQDAVILDTLEITAMPEAALAAAEDLADSEERLAEVIDWLGSAA
ncbi:hydrogenase expression/formation protein [Derxia gummosa]|uniref:Hydrogenase expression/formation protein n=1 Tax=Derxia gummosa DSM 723 TaxID=1121388 RepID=A0A8B6X7E1_9BURK|nr:hydrogenase expression/formation protein [Derxia gummosa]